MASVKITDSIERVGEVSITKVESYEDFASWQADKNKALTDAITSLTGGYGVDDPEPLNAEIKVAKKTTKH